MFFPHTSEIEIRRVDTEVITKEVMMHVQKRNHEIARRVVLKDLLRKPRSNARAIAVNERDVRMIAAQPFISEWNTQQRRYSDRHHEWKPKNKSQLSCIEKILTMCEENDLRLNILLASCFIAFSRRKYPLSLQIVISYGLEYYTAYSEQVFADMDEEISQTRSYGFE
jgi:hypothetical protein